MWATLGYLPFYAPSPTKRRPREQIDALKAHIWKVCCDSRPVTVRQVFYRLVSAGVVAKDEKEYKSTVCRLMGLMRDSGELPFSWVSDNTRWMRKPRTYTSMGEALRLTVETYRRAVWVNQPVYIEIWLEKDALMGVVRQETEPWDVPLMVARGFSSKTFLHSAAEAIVAQGKPAYIYHFGDLDPSGLSAASKVEAGLRKYAPGAEIHFERVAVTRQHVELYSLPTRATKKSDSRAKNFKGESVDVDALPPLVLRQMVRDCIARHLDKNTYEQLMIAEKAERELLRDFLGGIIDDDHET